MNAITVSNYFLNKQILINYLLYFNNHVSVILELLWYLLSVAFIRVSLVLIRISLEYN